MKSTKPWDYNKIRGRLIEKGVTMTDLAEKCRTARAYVFNVCKGKTIRETKIQFRIKYQVAEILDASYEEIWAEEDVIFYGKWL